MDDQTAVDVSIDGGGFSGWFLDAMCSCCWELCILTVIVARLQPLITAIDDSRLLIRDCRYCSAWHYCFRKVCALSSWLEHMYTGERVKFRSALVRALSPPLSLSTQQCVGTWSKPWVKVRRGIEPFTLPQNAVAWDGIALKCPPRSLFRVWDSTSL